MACVSFLNHPDTKDEAMLHTLYGLFLALPLLGLNIIIALCINLTLLYCNKEDLCTNTQRHLKWQQQTVAVSGALIALCNLLTESWPLFLSIGLCFIWFNYKMAQGWLTLMERQAIALT